MRDIGFQLIKTNFSLVLFFAAFSPSLLKGADGCTAKIEDFTASEPGSFPEKFTAHDESKLKKVIEKGGYYVVQKEGENQFLRATAHNDGLIIHKNYSDWDLEKKPYLSWRWRARVLPKGASEKYIRTNDAAASVYVIWPASALMRVKSIKFTWSASLDEGTNFSRRFGLDHVHVLRNPKSALNEWRTEKVNVLELYKKYYGVKANQPIEKPIAVAVLTDSDATDSHAEADYDDFYLCENNKPTLGVSPASVQKNK